MTLAEIAFIAILVTVFAIAAARGFHNWLLEQRREFAIIYTMIAVLSIFVFVNYD